VRDEAEARPLPMRGKRLRRRRYFIDLDRPAQVAHFMAWLPAEIRDAPGIEWAALPPEAMGYLIRRVGQGPDAAVIALGVGSAIGGVKPRYLKQLATYLSLCLASLRAVCGIAHLARLAEADVWYDYAARTEMTGGRLRYLQIYSSVSEAHYRRYLEYVERHAPHDYARLCHYALPPMPYGYLKAAGGDGELRRAAERRRKAQSDVLAPLHHVLVALIQHRLHAARRMLGAFHEARARVLSGQEPLPLTFAYEDWLPALNRDARTVADIRLDRRRVALRFRLWDRRSWGLAHLDRYDRGIGLDIRKGQESYAPGKGMLFVEFLGPPEDLLWFGDIVAWGLLRTYSVTTARHNAAYATRKQRARDLGAPMGFVTSRAGLLFPADQWFADAYRPGDLIFEPASLYRGALYGAALATIALTNGSRVGELLQVSYDRFGKHVATVTATRAGRPVTTAVPIVVQHLLPKGAARGERQLFPLSKGAVALLKEIHQHLTDAHGAIPVVAPGRQVAQRDELERERYLFQWAASPDGQFGVLEIQDVGVLLRFILHGLELRATTGEPIRIATHLLRHVTATGARHYRNVPPEAIALLLHHRQRAAGQAGAAPLNAATEYYSAMPRGDQLALVHLFQDELEREAAGLELLVPTERDLETMGENVRAVFEAWRTLLPTAFGYCGCPGLCIRGDDAALCIGCPFLVPDPSEKAAARAWRDAFAWQADLLDDQGKQIDARQQRRRVQGLDDILAVMRLQEQAAADGAWRPPLTYLPAPCAGEGSTDG